MLATVLLAQGIGILVIAMIPIRAIIQQLPTGTTRNRWKILSGFIGIFFIGYILYTILMFHSGIPTTPTELVVPFIFFFGAIFIYLVCSLSLKTTEDLRRIYILEQETITDPLTGMFNRRYLDRRIAEEFQRAMRFVQTFSIFLLDIDHFKIVNDLYGHQVGDAVLQKLGHLLMASVREVDVVIRYGGEEILVILPNTSKENAVELAERLRQQIETTVMVAAVPRQPAINITVSIGVAEYQFSDGWDNGQKVVERADKALYRAKEKGRNQVLVSQICDESG